MESRYRCEEAEKVSSMEDLWAFSESVKDFNVELSIKQERDFLTISTSFEVSIFSASK